GEFAAETNYLYITYHGAASDVTALADGPIMLLGSGPYCIGSSVEFDWCAVNAVKTLRRLGQKTIMLNSNPETVSTDFDVSDRLYFEELTLERVQDIADFEHNYAGIVLAAGGQIANNLALPLERTGYRLLGTPAGCIDRAEDRQKFSSLLGRLGIDQPSWQEVKSLNRAKAFALQVGYPVLIRPSYVLSGGAMNVVTDETELEVYLDQATTLSPDHPVVMSKFITNAKELEVDGVARAGKIVIEAISEHIENAGIHSGDATVVLPPQRLYLETIRRAKNITRQVVKALEVTGPFNIQFIAQHNELKVIECNVRASRSFPFVSKVTNHNFIALAVEAMLGIDKHHGYETLELDYVGVKSPQFSYSRLKGADPVAHVEMASTGEVACLGDTLPEAFYASWLATEQSLGGQRLLISAADDQRHKLIEAIQQLPDLGWEIYATKGMHNFLQQHAVRSQWLHKVSERSEPNVATVINQRQVDLIINIPGPSDRHNSDGFKIRRLAIDNHIPLITNPEIAQLFLQCLADGINTKQVAPKSWQDFMAHSQRY
ncbi:MAG TPA: ATP-grasp domain-containing protein, partial [Candidatus Saccharimonadales bacterium]|nr:ATP-grasp domain-containing protein [Candidatus Saccharimonadales bacterium]